MTVRDSLKNYQGQIKPLPLIWGLPNFIKRGGGGKRVRDKCTELSGSISDSCAYESTKTMRKNQIYA